MEFLINKIFVLRILSFFYFIFNLDFYFLILGAESFFVVLTCGDIPTTNH